MRVEGLRLHYRARPLVVATWITAGSTFLSAAPPPRMSGPGTAEAVSYSQEAELLASDGAAGHRLGSAVAVSGDTALVGAPEADGAGMNAEGAVYVFERDPAGTEPWTETAKLTASDGTFGDELGIAVAIDGDTAIVGARSAGRGAAYVFVRDSTSGAWGEEVKLTPSLFLVEDDLFGESVAINGDTVVVGAPGIGAFDYPGAAYVFSRDEGGPGNWGEVALLEGEEFADVFGHQVAVNADTVAVATGADLVYLFERDAGGAGNWGLVTTLAPSDPQMFHNFASSVAISGDTTLVGATGDDDAADAGGAAYVFERDAGGADAWGEVAELTASDAQELDFFGVSVAIREGLLVVGADNGDGSVADEGAAYVFERDADGLWQEVDKLTADDGVTGAGFGLSVALDGDLVAVGSPLDDEAGSDSGSAYVYRRDCTAADGVSLVLRDDTVVDVQVYEVCETITVGPNFVVAGPDGDLTLRAGGAVILDDGTSVATGGTLRVEAGVVVSAPRREETSKPW